MTSSSPFASWLRAQPSLTGTPPELDLDDLPGDPATLFERWIRAAAASGVAEPHAGTLATADSGGTPDARTLIVKDVSARGWGFAGPRDSAKARQLDESPAAAMNFWWPSITRAVRVRGPVQEASDEESTADLAERSAAARAGIRPGEWVRWWLVPEQVEFWQGATDRRHVRIVYAREGERWSCTIREGEQERGQR